MSEKIISKRIKARVIDFAHAIFYIVVIVLVYFAVSNNIETRRNSAATRQVAVEIRKSVDAIKQDNKDDHDRIIRYVDCLVKLGGKPRGTVTQADVDACLAGADVSADVSASGQGGDTGNNTTPNSASSTPKISSNTPTQNTTQQPPSNGGGGSNNGGNSNGSTPSPSLVERTLDSIKSTIDRIL